MPWNNLPESDWPAMESCVNKVMAQGHDKQSASAICYTSIVGKKSIDEAIQMLKDGKIDIEAITGQKADYPWDKCIQDQLDRGYSQESADKICGFIRNGGKGMPTEEELSAILKELNINPAKSYKSGARHSAEDRKAIREVRTKAKEIHDLSVQLEASDSDEPAAKSAWQGEVYNILTLEVGAVKAAGDWTLDVLGVPFGGPLKGKDTDGQYFSDKTNLHLELMPEIPVYYYHGRDPNGKPMGEPVIVGKAKFDHKDAKGYWFKAILDKTLELAKRVWDAAKNGIARASSDSASQYVRFNQATGEITNWPLIGISVFDADGKRQPANAYAVAMPAAKMMFENAGMTMPDYPEEQEPQADGRGAEAQSVANAQASIGTKSAKGVLEMETKEIQEMIGAALKADREARAAEDKAEADKKSALDVAVEIAVKAEKAKWEAEVAKGRRLPGGGGFATIAKDGDLWKYDNLDAGDQAVLIGVLASAHKNISPHAYKALAVKLAGDKSETGEIGRNAMKMAGVKADEIDYSTLANYGDEWVGIAYSNALWEAIRIGTFVVDKLPQVEIPQDYESIYLPLESTDPVWYNVAENLTSVTAGAVPTPTVAASALGTGRVLLSLAKLGARVVWTGELDEGSLIPFTGQLRAQLAASGAEYLESAVIDGDPTLSVANINATDGAGGTAGKWYTVWNGMRMSALITTAANSRSAAGGLDVTDYLETVKLMGTGGRNALDVTKVGFIIDASTHFKTLTLPELLTKDVFSSPTIEGGKITSLWGYPVNISGAMCKNSAKRLSTAAGDISLTDSGNLYGTILAVRWDQWKFGWRRRMTMETTRFANSDSNEIVAMVRCGLIQRDTEASAVTYYVGV